MTNTSATGGYLQPVVPGPGPLEGDALQDFLQAVVVGVTGMQGAWVRPRWQLQPPDLPPVGQDWAAIGVVTRRKGAFATLRHNVPGYPDGTDLLQRQQELDVLTSFYGPNAEANAELWADGVAVEQNRAILNLNGFGLASLPGDPISAPILMRQQWLMRIDVPTTFVRVVTRLYPILDILEVDGTVYTDQTAQPGAVPFPFSTAEE